MRRVQNRGSALLAVGLISLLLAADEGAAQSVAGARADANDPTNGADSRWLPGLSFQTGILVQERDADGDSVERGIVVGDSRAFFGLVGASAEVSTPRIPIIPGRPRLFARADVSYSVDKTEAVVNQGDPGDPINNPGNEVDVNDPVSGVINVGTSLRAKSEPLILSGGLGMVFSREFAGRTVSLRPSLEWMYQRDEISIAFGDAETEGSDPLRCAPCRATSVLSQRTKGYHSLGPGVEVDIDAGRVGDFKVNVFTRFSALRILGDRKSNLQAIGSWFTRQDEKVNGQNIILSIDPAVGREDSVVSGRYRRDPWSYAATAGIRIVWSPE